MAIRVGNAPCSWGVDYADEPGNLPWERCMDEVSAAGYDCIDLGPVGYFPEDAAELRAALARRGLSLTAGHLFEPFHDPRARETILAQARRVCRVLSLQAVARLVVIDHITPERGRTAGRSNAARRLEATEWKAMMALFTDVAKLAQDEFGCVACLHPHAACYVEFRDEIDRAMGDLDSRDVRLCIDTGHSAYAGVDPAKLLRDYAGRVAHLHFKDTDAGVRAKVVDDGVDFDAAVRRGVFCRLGSGMADFDDFAAAMAEVGYAGWASIEQDVDTSRGDDPLANAKASLAFLRQVGIAG